MPTRKPLRLAAHDYGRAGAYFITVCAARRGHVFGRLVGDAVVLGLAGRIVAEHLSGRLARLRGVGLPAWIVMPDHVHAVVLLDGSGHELPPVVGTLKSATTRDVVRRCAGHTAPLWQRGYHDHVVRDEDDLARVCAYIATNPLRSALRAGWNPAPTKTNPPPP